MALSVMIAVHSMVIVEEGANDALDIFLMFVNEWRTVVNNSNLSDVGFILVLIVYAGQELWYLQMQSLKFHENLLDVIDSICVHFTILLKIDANNFFAFSILLHDIIVGDYNTYMMGMAFNTVFDVKFIDNRGKYDGFPAVIPQTGGHGSHCSQQD